MRSRWITEVWSEALELPAAVTMPFASVRRRPPVGLQTAATLVSGDSMKRVIPLFRSGFLIWCHPCPLSGNSR